MAPMRLRLGLLRKKPGLTLFRWVAPINHRSVDPADMRVLADVQTSG